MTCRSCGPQPRIVIADGTVIATAKKFATGKLRLPMQVVEEGDKNSPLVASEDMVLQILPPVASTELDNFLTASPLAEPSPALLRLLPFLYDIVLALSFLRIDMFPPALKQFICLLHFRTKEVLNELLMNSAKDHVVVYDFACQLTQYAMVQEPEYFRNTRF
ncbi:hypothetical protein JCM5296_002183 [Sporobolomyces johnsonii]